jgi:inorganic pyrophosphatase
MRRFFEDYKVLEEKQVSIEDLLGPADAVAVIDEALRAYQALRSTKT